MAKKTPARYTMIYDYVNQYYVNISPEIEHLGRTN